MTVRSTADGAIELSGRCGVEDAEALQRQLLAAPRSTVEWSNCEQLHSAVIQVLLAGKPQVLGSPSNAFLRAHIAPLVQRAANRSAPDRTSGHKA
jgi:hypothetical protein